MNSQAQDVFNVVLVEDHPMFREQLAHLIDKEPAMTVCGQADNAHDALQLIELKNPDIAIVDLTLKGPSGLELIPDVAEVSRSMRGTPTHVAWSKIAPWLRRDGPLATFAPP